ncbi:MAG: zinc ribbon domain-containing protein [Thermoplasmata archaeon]|nr:zinc ribbon domain-containing protein [Thermoplasmata archaeon]MCI4355729.1 zinc ribbon domain-containing protein [Thermoplasmata archaeon]
MSEVPPLAIVRCDHCQARFLPHPGLCPRCGSDELVRTEIPAHATVLAATELLAPAAGWPSPHRLAILEATESVRILAIVRGPLPTLGSVVAVRRTNDLYEVVLPSPG